MVNLHSRSCIYPFKADLPHSTLEIYHLRQQQLFEIEHTFCSRQVTSCFESRAIYSRSMTFLRDIYKMLFEVEYFWDKWPLVQDWVQDWQFSFEIKIMWRNHTTGEIISRGDLYLMCNPPCQLLLHTYIYQWGRQLPNWGCKYLWRT